ncbi:MAG TPA: retropepsin-like aspartic protease [Gammaproteobacteria bacterium]
MIRGIQGFLILLVFVCGHSLAVDKIKVVGLFKDKAVIIIDGKQRILRKNATSPEGVTLISANSNEAILEVDGERKNYTLGNQVSIKFSETEPGRTVSIAPTNDLYLVNGSINDFQVQFLVDTGASSVAMNRQTAKRLGLNFRMDGQEGLSETASGYSKIYVVNLEKVTVGDIVLEDVEGVVHDSEFPRIILLGNSFLSKVHLRREGQLLLLEQ